MKFSVSELSYLRSSLVGTPPLRPDCRKPGQFRPVESEVDLLPFTNGSARVRAADGSECIVGIKTKVVSRSEGNLIEPSVDITGFKDNDPLPNSLAEALRQTLNACPELTAQLILTEKYAFRLYVDCVVLSFTSHPLSLLSLAVFRALKSTKLPQLISSRDDTLVDEIPQFNDDWEASEPICTKWSPPLVLLLAIVGDNVLLDPTDAELEVAETALCITWKNNAVAAPIKNVDIGSGKNVGSYNPKVLLDAYDLVQSCAAQVVNMIVS